VPPEAQAYIANLLEGRIDRRGRPKANNKEWRDTKLSMLQRQMDELVDFHTAEKKSARRKGAPNAKVVQRALDDLANEFDLETDTLKLYLRQAAKLTEISDAALAIEVNEDRERLEQEGAANPLNSALELYERKREIPLWSVKARYARGKRWLRRHVEDSPEFK
jgi:hypothetical protein